LALPQPRCAICGTGEVAEPTLAAIPSAIGTPDAAALDAEYFGPATLQACAKRSVEPSIATGRDPHHPSPAAAVRNTA